MSEQTSRVGVAIKVEGSGEARAELVRFLSPKTVDAILRRLPITGRAALWKEEIYFEIPVKMGPEKPHAEVETGDLAFWPMGSAFCIFYGKSQPYSPVNLVGKVKESLEIFRNIKESAKITIERA